MNADNTAPSDRSHIVTASSRYSLLLCEDPNAATLEFSTVPHLGTQHRKMRSLLDARASAYTCVALVMSWILLNDGLLRQ
jgi:hypothetical protein